jgi:hypothetical protein
MRVKRPGVMDGDVMYGWVSIHKVSVVKVVEGDSNVRVSLRGVNTVSVVCVIV